LNELDGRPRHCSIWNNAEAHLRDGDLLGSPIGLGHPSSDPVLIRLLRDPRVALATHRATSAQLQSLRRATTLTGEHRFGLALARSMSTPGAGLTRMYRCEQPQDRDDLVDELGDLGVTLALDRLDHPQQLVRVHDRTLPQRHHCQ
jgi:hypothetical protein